MNIKDKLYYYAVDKNNNVKTEYEGYNIHHLEEHKKHRLKSWVRLAGLNIKYRILKEEPFYPEVAKIESANESDLTPEFLNESKLLGIWKGINLVKKFVVYDYVVFNVFDTLIYPCISSKRLIYNMVGEYFKIPEFSNLRIKAEREIFKKYKGDKTCYNIYDIYSKINEYHPINIKKAIKAEIAVLKKILHPNPYIYNLYEMLSYNSENIIAVEDTCYTSENIRELIEACGYKDIKKIFVCNESHASIKSGGMFKFLKVKLKSSNIMYMDDNVKNEDTAKKTEFATWPYRNAYREGKYRRPQGLSDYVGDAYKNIVCQHLYCGYYQHSKKRELGYIFFGLLCLGYLRWISEMVRTYKITRLFFLETESEMLCNIYDKTQHNLISEKIFFSEELAVRCLCAEEPESFFEYYVDRYSENQQSVSYYLEKMDIAIDDDTLEYYGIHKTDIVKKNNYVYMAFMAFILENAKFIQELYKNEIKGAKYYLRNKKISSDDKVAIVNLTGKGYIARALVKLSDEGKKSVYTEFSAFQTHETSNAYAEIKSFLKTGKVKKNGRSLSIRDSYFLSNVFFDKAPRFKTFKYDSQNKIYPLFYNAYPWKYDALNEIQMGIYDFCEEYISICGNINELMHIPSEDVIIILKELLKYRDFLGENIPIFTR